MTKIEFIEHILRDVTPFVQQKYRSRELLEVTSKSDPNDLLTEVDLAVQDRIVAAIHTQFPGDDIVAEERDLSRRLVTTDARCWLLDPIDGTQNFVRGIYPVFGISLALVMGGRPVVGGVMLPMLEELFLAEQGAGAMCNGCRIRVSDVEQVAFARVEVDFAGPSERAETLQCGSRILREAGQIRCGVSCVVSLCSVACSQGDAFFHTGLSPWDYAAGILIVDEAGGKTTRLDNTEISVLDGRRGLLASNGHIHNTLLGIILGS